MLYLTLLALFPIIFLFVKIYRYDTKESEPLSLLVKIFLFGCLSIIPTILLEIALLILFSLLLDTNSITFLILENFIGIALIEESCKYWACKFASWKHTAFNYTFDGVVYCVVCSLGFAAVENILYVVQYGVSVAFVRAIFAVVGHAIFGLIMGYFYTKQKQASLHHLSSSRFTLLAILIPTLMHGMYDTLLSLDASWTFNVFLAYIFLVDIWAYRFIKQLSDSDRLL